MKTVLVLGATGATGRLVVKQLLAQGQAVRVLVRSTDKLDPWFNGMSHLDVVKAQIADLSVEQWQHHLQGITSVVSCLGHPLSFQGVYGEPRWLVSDTVANIHQAAQRIAPKKPIRYVLMNSTGVMHPQRDAQPSLLETLLFKFLQVAVPPQADNQRAADYLRDTVGENDSAMSWVIVRPDSLTDDTEVTRYLEEPARILSPLFDSGKTSRINVSHFMMRLVLDERTWRRWQGQAPVLYNV